MGTSSVLYLPLEPLQALKIAVIISLFTADFPHIDNKPKGCLASNLSVL